MPTGRSFIPGGGSPPGGGTGVSRHQPGRPGGPSHLVPAGFTVLELIIVVAILAALVTLGIPYYRDYVAESKHSVMLANLHAIRKALMEHHADRKVYPDKLEYLANPPADGVSQRYLLDIPVDPEEGAVASWGYATQAGGTAYTLDAKYDTF